MSKLKKPVVLESAFATYTLTEQIGQGGAGRVFLTEPVDGARLAIKVLSEERASADTRKRFKNETAFLLNNDHRNVVKVIDYGVAKNSVIRGPFYVMSRYDGNLRDALQQITAGESRLQLYSQILDGVEAAHFRGVIHRDLKPENILFDSQGTRLAVADFGVARFTEGELATLVETSADKRLANFVYAAPEQRTPGRPITQRTDIYSLGLILNEMITGEVPHGQDYKAIGAVVPELAFLDRIVAKMLSQDPTARYDSIQAIKSDIQKYRAEAVSLQKLDEMKRTVVPLGDITDPLAIEPLKITQVEWRAGRLYITVDRTVNAGWINAFRNIGNYRSFMGSGPSRVSWDANVASIEVAAQNAQQQLDMFKEWLPTGTAEYRRGLENVMRTAEARRKQELQRSREEEEQRLRVNSTLKF